MNKDMSQYRANRTSSKVVQTWLSKYKQQTLEHVIFRHYRYDSSNEEYVNIVNNNPECAEIVADTLIGWLNSPVGRVFLKESFDINIPCGNDGIDEGEVINLYEKMHNQESIDIQKTVEYLKEINNKGE